MKNTKAISDHLAHIMIEIGAIKLSPEKPFKWASGNIMPIYTDNRLLLCEEEFRRFVSRGFCEIIQNNQISVDLVAGTATAGIPHATTLANDLKLPLSYVRPEPKGHGRKKIIEGSILLGENAILVEDLISTGTSAIKAIKALRGEGMHVDNCLAIFTYGLKNSINIFKDNNCKLHTLLTFPKLIEYSISNNLINNKQKEMLNDWYKDPFEWGKRFK